MQFSSCMVLGWCVLRKASLIQSGASGEGLGWVDLDLGSSPGWWADIVAKYCPSRMVEHPESKSNQPSPSPDAPDCMILTAEILLLIILNTLALNSAVNCPGLRHNVTIPQD